MTRILITPQAFELFGDNLDSLFGDEYDIEFTGGIISNKKELISKLKKVDGFIIGSEKIDEEVLNECPNLKVLSRFGVGYNSIDITQTNLNNVMVAVVPDMNPLAVARHCLALLLSFTNNIILQNNHNGDWIRNYNLSPEENDIGLIGLGPIGLCFAHLCKKIGYKVNYYSRTNKNVTEFNYVDSIDELIQKSQIISLHLKSTMDTKKIINKDRIDMMYGKLFLNTARGDLVDEDYLYHSLCDKKLLGAGLDVFTNEPSFGISEKLQKLENVISTCHTAVYDNYSIKNTGLKSIDNIKYFFEGNFEKINRIVEV